MALCYLCPKLPLPYLRYMHFVLLRFAAFRKVQCLACLAHSHEFNSLDDTDYSMSKTQLSILFLKFFKKIFLAIVTPGNQYFKIGNSCAWYPLFFPLCLLFWLVCAFCTLVVYLYSSAHNAIQGILMRSFDVRHFQGIMSRHAHTILYLWHFLIHSMHAHYLWIYFIHDHA